MLSPLLKVALKIDERIKIAAKDKVSKRNLSSKLEKYKQQFAKDKKEHDILAKEHGKLTDKFNDAKKRCAEGRKAIKRMHNALQMADVADASDIQFYPDSDDVSYIIDGKECHVEMDDMGEVQVTPWRDYRRHKKTELPQETSLEIMETNDQSSEEANCGDMGMAADQGSALDENMVDDLYSELIV